MTADIKNKEVSNNIDSLQKALHGLNLMLNILNQIIIIFITIYILVLAFTYEKFDLFEYHVVLGTLGYQLFMAESILSLSRANITTRLFSKDTKRIIHLFLGVISTALVIAATVVIVINRKKHFYTKHGLFGLAALVLLVPTTINGPFTFVSQRLNRKVKPVYMRVYHTCTSTLAFVCGVACLCTGYKHGWFKRQVPTEFVPMFIVLSSVTIVLTLKDPIVEVVQTVRGVVRAKYGRL